MTTEKNKVTFGLENVHWVEIESESEEGVLTYGNTVHPQRGAVELTLDPSGDTNIFKADNVNYHTSESNDGYTGKLKIAKLTDLFCQNILGEVLDPTSKVMTEVANVKKKRFALMFQIEGDSKGTRHVLYNCSAQRPSGGSATKDGGNVNTTELNFNASPRPLDKVVKRRTTEETPEDTYKKWFDKPFEPNQV